MQRRYTATPAELGENPRARRTVAGLPRRRARAPAVRAGLITRDTGFFRDYFKGLKVIVPKHPARFTCSTDPSPLDRPTMPPPYHDQLVQDAQVASSIGRPARQVLFAAGARKTLGVDDLAPAGLDPHRARIGAAQLRRQEGHRGARAANSRNWKPTAARTDEIPFVVARIVLQDFTGVPLLADLAAMRDVADADGQEPEDDRAAGAGRSGGRPLGADRSLPRSRTRST